MILSLKNITKNFGKTEVLKEINIDLNEGEILTILGASGSGKSTILNLIAGFEKPTSGTIGIYEKIVSSNEEFMEPHERNVGFVFQNYALFPHLNVFKNISFGILDKETNKQKRVVEEMMKLTGLEGLEKRYPHELSGGQQQQQCYITLYRLVMSQKQPRRRCFSMEQRAYLGQMNQIQNQ